MKVIEDGRKRSRTLHSNWEVQWIADKIEQKSGPAMIKKIGDSVRDDILNKKVIQELLDENTDPAARISQVIGNTETPG
uniref:Uncharacterized protein n=1 Tax=Setaria digitata TaxID=48799 RepID=A0A915Q035_9BILA